MVTDFGKGRVLGKASMRFATTLFDLGQHGLKSQAPDGMDTFIRDFMALVFKDEDMEELDITIQVHNRRRELGDDVVKLGSVNTGRGSIQLYVRIPGTQEARLCDISVAGVDSMELYLAVQGLIAFHGRITLSNWAVVQEARGHNPYSLFWTPERTERFMQAVFFKNPLAGANSTEMTACEARDFIKALVEETGVPNDKGRALLGHVRHLVQEEWISEPKQLVRVKHKKGVRPQISRVQGVTLGLRGVHYVMRKLRVIPLDAPYDVQKMLETAERNMELIKLKAEAARDVKMAAEGLLQAQDAYKRALEQAAAARTAMETAQRVLESALRNHEAGDQLIEELAPGHLATMELLDKRGRILSALESGEE